MLSSPYNWILIFIISIGSLFVIYYFMRRSLVIMSGISRMNYDQKGKFDLKGSLTMYSAVIMLVLFLIVFTLLRLILENGFIAAALSIFIVYVVFRILYSRAGRDIEDWLMRKKMHEREFTQMITPEQNTCHSCMKKIDGRYCASCGFDNVV